MTINLNTNVTFANINRWRVLSPPDGKNQVAIRFTSPGDTQSLVVFCTLSDTVNQSIGVSINPTPAQWDDKIIVVPGIGAASSLTNAQNAYRGAANHNAGLRAIEGVAMTDGWVSGALAGT